MNNHTAAFVMPLKLSGDETELRHLMESVASIKQQTDSNWVLIIVDDYSHNDKVYDALESIKQDLKEKVYVIYSHQNYGAGTARNKGIRLANELGAPFILYNDSDDLSDPERLRLVREAFEADETVNVVYTSFDVIDENGDDVPLDKLNPTVREIIEGHQVDVVEGECAWIPIAAKKKYTNLTSCTAVKTSLALEEPFPKSSVSEDCHTWLRYGAHPGKFVFLKQIKGKYRICSGMASRSRSSNDDFYQKMFEMDSSGFEAAMELAKKYDTMGGLDEDDLRAAFYVRLALCLIHGGEETYCKKALAVACDISREQTLRLIDLLYCEDEAKERMKALLAE
ncbi:MAG: glycosyltransferase family 2 protein [Ruminococcaceae bacterium]|nr:glycosyltransferase family 2 protein [Oscillospiraceae bacterium]